jgi:hypothetical protein
MHLTETHAASRWVWTYVTGQRGSRLIVRHGGQESGNRPRRQEERNSRVADIGTGVTRASWAAFYVTKGLDVTAHGKNETRPTMAEVAQGKA